MTPIVRSVLWRMTDDVGLEHATFAILDDVITIEGTVVTSHENQPLTVTYRVECDGEWRTRNAIAVATLSEVRYWRLAQVSTRGQGRWLQTTLDGERLPVFPWNGCYDIDLGFSPVTNTIVIRRLDLDVGQSAEVDAAWVRYPDFELRRLPQRYTRTADQSYRYESVDSGFQAELEVDDLGLVVRYGRHWVRLAWADGLGDSPPPSPAPNS